MKTIVWAIVFCVGMMMGGNAQAVPVLQVGAPAGLGDVGSYADYQASPTGPPTESDTALTGGSTLYVGGTFQTNAVALGGKYGSGSDWQSFVGISDFNGKGAILVVSVPDGELASALASLTVNGLSAFYSSSANSYLPNPPSNHDPAKGGIADFLFFDIGNFAEVGSVPNFADETGAASGEIKTLTLSGMNGLDWIHFDVMALETDQHGTRITTNMVGNPGSHDVTYKPGYGIQIPEPGTLLLLGFGLTGLYGYGFRKRIRK